MNIFVHFGFGNPSIFFSNNTKELIMLMDFSIVG